MNDLGDVAAALLAESRHPTSPNAKMPIAAGSGRPDAATTFPWWLRQIYAQPLQAVELFCAARHKDRHKMTCRSGYSTRRANRGRA
jgi:hypothetical protein